MKSNPTKPTKKKATSAEAAFSLPAKLTPKQAMFVKEYLIDLNATQAAIRAGYSEKTARVIGIENLSKPVIENAIQEAMDKRSEKTEITADYVLETIRDTVERCRQSYPVLDRQGKPIMVETETGEFKPAYTFDPASVLKGCDLLGKNLMLWKDSGSKENPLNVIHKIERVVVKP